MTSFHFQVEWGNSLLGFNEVTGLTIEQDIIDYTKALSTEQYKMKENHNIILKRGIVKDGIDFLIGLILLN